MKVSGVGSAQLRTSGAVTGLVLLVLALVVGLLGSRPASAQDLPIDGAGDEEADPDADEGASDDAEAGEPLTIDSSTLFVSPLTDALPPTLTKNVPPSAICVLQPDLCPESSEPLRNAIVDLFAQVQDNAQDLPVQPVPPDSAAVSFVGGATRYQTAITFDPPALPEGEDVMRFELTFPQSQPTYDLSSPSFRRAVLGVFEWIGHPDRDPAVLFEGLVASLEEQPIDTSKVLSFEACPLLEPVEPGGAPQASQDSELPTHEDDGETVTAVDCTLGGNGVYDEEAELWRLDLAFTAQAWAEGELDNHGVLLRPIGAPNLAFGDADTSTMAQLVLDLTDVTIAVETAEPFEPAPFPEEPSDDTPPVVAEDVDDGFTAGAPDLGDGGSDLGAPLDAPDFPTSDVDDVPLAADAPQVADDVGAGEPEVALDAQAARPAGSAPTTPWWVWLVAPLVLGGAYLTASSVLAPAPVVAAGGGGALTRLLEKHAVPSAPTQI